MQHKYTSMLYLCWHRQNMDSEFEPLRSWHMSSPHTILTDRPKYIVSSMFQRKHQSFVSRVCVPVTSLTAFDVGDAVNTHVVGRTRPRQGRLAAPQRHPGASRGHHLLGWNTAEEITSVTSVVTQGVTSRRHITASLYIRTASLTVLWTNIGRAAVITWRHRAGVLRMASRHIRRYTRHHTHTQPSIGRHNVTWWTNRPSQTAADADRRRRRLKKCTCATCRTGLPTGIAQRLCKSNLVRQVLQVWQLTDNVLSL